jgi:mono/diheme cytochrome c family protein
MAGEETMTRPYSVATMGFLLAGVALGAQLAGLAQSTPAPAPKIPAIQLQTQTEAERGERAFKANCSRCHYAPDTLNPRITGTVIRHMRVRANLSAAEERAILQFLNP